jgi:hypothetical protein
MSELHRKVLERVKFDPSVCEQANREYWDAHEKNTILFNEAKSKGETYTWAGTGPLYEIIGKAENARLLPIITQLLKMNEELVSAVERSQEWIVGQHEMPMYSELISDNETLIHSNQAQMEKLAGEK